MADEAIPFECDVAVIGAGPAGAATARRLARVGCRVLLAERSHFDTPRVGESLAPGVQPLLRDLGVWDQFLALQPLPSYGTRSFWGGSQPEEHSHLMTPWGSGWHVDRCAFDRMLAEAARAAGAVLLCGATFLRCQWSGEDWCIAFQHRRSDRSQRLLGIRARLVIDATGRAARLASWVGAERLLLDRLIGIAAEFHGIDVAHARFLTIEAAPHGWWYAAPVPGDRIVVLLMTDSDICRQRGLAKPVRWHECLHNSAATRERIALGAPAWGPRVFSAISQRVRRSGRRNGWLAVGDAALALDPITGSGVIRALRSAQAAVEVVLGILRKETPFMIDAHEKNCDLECATYLQERELYYGVEQRWPDEPFWRRRAGG